ncbi:MAG: hypothetical protein JWN75_1247 [Candidatus Saccharibacteria bacterium]|nr:hypothetical protein [Candidatus Saccharibacteria bacterium]
MPSNYISLEAVRKRTEAAIPELARRVWDGETDIDDLPVTLQSPVALYLITGRLDVANLLF